MQVTDQTLTRKDFTLPLVVTLLFIAWVVTFHVSMISLGDISHYDESLNLDRSTSFLIRGDWWNVYTNNVVNFNKPPLQYWMSALLIDRGVDLTVALRLPSFVFGALCLFATALFAYSIFPTLPWIIPISVLFVSSSDRLWESSLMAMLDTGSLFFVTLALAGMNLVLRDSRWWYLVGFSIAAGALQKAPIALGFVAGYMLFLVLTAPLHRHSLRGIFLNRHFWISIALGVLLGFSWHIWQYVQHGATAIQQGIGREMVGRIAPTVEADSTKPLREVASHIFGAEGAIRLFGLIAVFFVPHYFRRYDLLPIPLVLLAYMLVYAFAGGHLSDRYTMLFITIVSVMLAGGILSSSYSFKAKAMAVFVLSLFSGGPAKPPDDLRLFAQPYIITQKEILTVVGQDADYDRALLVCNWNQSERIIPGQVTYYEGSGRRHTRINSQEMLDAVFRSGRIAGPVEGVCRDQDFKDLERYLTDIEIRTRIEPYVHFRAQVKQAL